MVKLVMLPTWIAVLPFSMSPPWIALGAQGATDVDSGGATDVDSGVLSTWIAGFCFLILSGLPLRAAMPEAILLRVEQHSVPAKILLRRELSPRAGHVSKLCQSPVRGLSLTVNAQAADARPAQ